MPDNIIELIVKTTDQASSGLKAISGQVDSLGKAYDSLNSILGGLAAGFTFDKLIESITGAQKATYDLDRQFNQFGSTVGVSEEDMVSFAETTARSTTLTSESLKEAQANLLNYTSLTGSAFTQARDLVVDLAAKMGGDAADAATLLGRALQNPVSGIRLLAQVGVTLTTQQRAVIASLEQTGGAAQATAFILDTLKQHLAGAADAASSTLGGALTQLKNSFAEGFTGAGADIKDLTDSIHGLNDIVNDPRFQESLHGVVGFIVDISTAAIDGVNGIRDLAEALAHLFGGADTPEGQLQDKKTALQDLLAQPNLDPTAANDYIKQLAAVQAQLDKLSASAAEAAKHTADLNADMGGADFGGKNNNGSWANAPPKKPTPLFDPLQHPLTLGPNAQHIDDNQSRSVDPVTGAIITQGSPLANPFLPPSLVEQYLQDTESAFDRGLADYQTHVLERQDLVNANLLSSQSAALQNNNEFQDLQDANFDPIKITAKHIGGSLDEIDKEGQRVAQDLTGAFTSFFESSDHSLRNFGLTFIKVIDQIFAKAISTDIVGALGLGKLFDQPGTSSQFGGLLGAIGGALGFGSNGASTSTATGDIINANTVNSGLDSGVISAALTKLLGFAGGGQVAGGPIVVGEEGPEIFTPGVSGSVMNQRQLAFQGAGSASGLVYSPSNTIYLTTDNSDKNTAALLQYLTVQQNNQQKDFERKLKRNGFTLR